MVRHSLQQDAVAAGRPEIPGGRPLSFPQVRKLLRAPAVLLALTFALALNFHVIRLVFPYDDDRLLQLIALAAVAILIIARSSLREELAARLAASTRLGRLLIAGGGTLALLSVAQARRPSAGVTELGLFVLLGLAALSIAIRPRGADDNQDLEAAAVLVFLAIGAYEVQFLAAYSAALLGDAPLMPRELFSGFATPRFLGQVQTWTLPLAVLPILLLTRVGPLWRAILFLVPSLWWTIALATGGRGTMAASILAACAALALFRGRAHRWLLAAVASALAGLCLYLLLFTVLPAMTANESGPSYSIARSVTQTSRRLELWKAALELIRSAPLLGVGPMHYACTEISQGAKAHPHNALLQLAAEWGTPFALIVVSGISLWFWRWQRGTAEQPNRDSTSDVVAVALSASLLAAAAHAMLSGIIVMPLSQTLGVLVLGSMLRFRRPGSAAVDAAGAPTHTRLLAGLVLAALLGLGASLPPLIDNYSARIGAEGVHSWLAEPPRFWKAGAICERTAP